LSADFDLTLGFRKYNHDFTEQQSKSPAQTNFKAADKHALSEVEGSVRPTTGKLE
jgi:hypothetical protein